MPILIPKALIWQLIMAKSVSGWLNGRTSEVFIKCDWLFEVDSVGDEKKVDWIGPGHLRTQIKGSWLQ